MTVRVQFLIPRNEWLMKPLYTLDHGVNQVLIAVCKKCRSLLRLHLTWPAESIKQQFQTAVCLIRELVDLHFHYINSFSVSLLLVWFGATSYWTCCGWALGFIQLWLLPLIYQLNLRWLNNWLRRCLSVRWLSTALPVPTFLPHLFWW